MIILFVVIGEGLGFGGDVGGWEVVFGLWKLFCDCLSFFSE